jgi:hypothetical protein
VCKKVPVRGFFPPLISDTQKILIPSRSLLIHVSSLLYRITIIPMELILRSLSTLALLLHSAYALYCKDGPLLSRQCERLLPHFFSSSGFPKLRYAFLLFLSDTSSSSKDYIIEIGTSDLSIKYIEDIDQQIGAEKEMTPAPPDLQRLGSRRQFFVFFLLLFL